MDAIIDKLLKKYSTREDVTKEDLSDCYDQISALKADGNITVTGGEFTIDSVDDAVNAEGDVLIEGGSFRIDTDDDGIHGDASVTINGGEFVINAHEAIESTVITINDGTIDIYATDDYGEDAITRYDNGAVAVQALLAGKVDCVIIDNEPAKSYVAANEGLKVLDTEYTVEDYAICFAKENTELQEKVNGALEELIKDGSVKEVIEKYIPAE